MKPVTCTRRIEFDSAHRVMRHESKCRNMHGHRYVAEVTAQADPDSVEGVELDSVGRVVDFGVIKSVIGAWIDDNWDHGTILNRDDEETVEFIKSKGWKLYLLDDNPTAEVMSRHLLEKSKELLRGSDMVRCCVKVTHVRLYETPNCWADADTDEY